MALDKCLKPLTCNRCLKGRNLINQLKFDPKDGTVKRGDARCLICEQITKAKDVRQLGQSQQIGQRLIISIYQHPDQAGKSYRIATKADAELYLKATKQLKESLIAWPFLESPLPTEEIPLMSGTFNVPIYGLDRWDRLFNQRQLLGITTLLRLIRQSDSEISKECNQLKKANLAKLPSDVKELNAVIMAYLAIMLDRIVDFGSTLCVLNSVGGRGVVHTFGRQALPMTWDYMESNIFNPAGAQLVCIY